MNAASPIFVGQLPQGVVWVRVVGKGSFQNSPALREFAGCMVERGANRFVVDLDDCTSLDSTFMGTLVGIVGLFDEDDEEAGLEVINANPRCAQLLRSLGLDHVFSIDTEGASWPEVRKAIAAALPQTKPLDQVDLDKGDNTQHLLDAHQNLSAADTANVPRFRDVIEFLEKELRTARA